ncbi:hypothetical protein [Xylanibacter ruminicola]|uniref:Uncharacterized protein n=1 Tax=Xylanibacter ruminicola TaxID=839 RepID=A0A1M6TUM2_XYLRU|nr:hypothetical protein [Xylanibacter ruminicola]SHK60735.1 hypothetical protein SAMN05216463_10729 [Xylanibacter ruminicola]
MKKVNNTYKEQILHNVQMDTQTTFMNNGDINIYPCVWEQDNKPVTADGNSRIRYRAGVTVDEDGRTHMKRYRDGLNGPKHETLFETAHGAVKATRPYYRKTACGGHKAGERIINREYVYVTFKFPKKYGRALIMSLYQEEADQIMSYLKTRKEETIW